MFNTVTLVGRLTRDAELGPLPNDKRTPRLRFTLAVDRDYEVDGETPTDFWPVEILGEYGVRLAPHLAKGRLVLAHGAAHINSNKDADGAFHLFPFVAVRSIRFLEKKPEWLREQQG
jgi:single-stranded DNA-binding protein